ncbi:DUF6548 family protein [Solobacterium sp.]|uniref:DUF6548 family protein n=1 Tax=Solobacterium sp. TaxID=2060878 RepID=UPI001CB1831D|nr:DUF6548 family protein [Solobacterium sp.]MBF1086249.1 hypothetical protein [Solobacterium sp.]
MNVYALDYLESYKRLDQLCRDMFRSKDGVTEYINQMDRVISRINSKQDWRNFYSRLKYQRRLRNDLVHNTECSECTEEDIDEIEYFFDLILKQEDPLACIRKQQTLTRHASIQTSDSSSIRREYHSKKSGIVEFLIYIIVFIAMIVLIFTQIH